MSAHQFNWETHHQIMNEVVNLLEANGLIPSKLSIQPDGWTEAVFLSANSLDLKRVWLRLQRRAVIEVKRPILERDTQNGTLLRVIFRVAQQKVFAQAANGQ